MVAAILVIVQTLIVQTSCEICFESLTSCRHYLYKHLVQYASSLSHRADITCANTLCNMRRVSHIVQTLLVQTPCAMRRVSHTVQTLLVQTPCAMRRISHIVQANIVALCLLSSLRMRSIRTDICNVGNKPT
ncbi:hypothetical protein TNCV_4599381 [Trichonephila clavipes]|nr:hypothetical protein TNCV_4599381 [Trichonephila clavipes]